MGKGKGRDIVMSHAIADMSCISVDRFLSLLRCCMMVVYYSTESSLS